MTRRVVGLPVLVAIVAACSAPGAPSTGGTPSESIDSPGVTAAPPASAAPTAGEIARIEGTFDIGGGRELYIRCIGSGTTTILLEAGDGSSGTDDWSSVSGELSDATRTCVYDRAGLGRSSPATGCRQLDDLLDDLDALLATAGVEGPYVLVGASGGGFIMAGFAMRHPDDVAGMVFVETPKALTAELYPDVVPEIACDAPGNVERRDYLAVEHEAWDDRTEIGDFPLVVLTNDYGDTAEPNTDEATNVKDQRGWFDLSPEDARQVVITSGHDIASNEPDLIIEEVLTVLAAAQGP